MPLANAKHEAVALAYIADPEKNGARAYRSVYPNSSQKAAAVGFSRLLTDANFAARVAELSESATQGKVLAAQQVLEEISAIAINDESSGVRLRALELMGKHHVLFTEKHVHEFGGVAERLAAALERIGDRQPHAEKPGPAHDSPRRRHARKAPRKGKRVRA